jgi:glucokinase
MADGHKVSNIEKTKTPAGSDFWPVVVERACEYAKGRNLTAIKIGTAGAIDGDIVNSSRAETSFALGKELRERLGAPVKIANDLYGVALGELKEGAAKSVKDGLVVTVSTGLAAVVIKDGQILPTPDRLDDEFGHQEVPGDLVDPEFKRRACTCSRKVCYDRYASGSAVYDRARQQGMELKENRDFDKLAETGNAKALELYEDEGRLLAEWLAEILKKHPVPVVIFQGTFARKGMGFLLLPMAERLGELVSEIPEIRLGELGDDAGLIGATYL